jgi:hypothetical protein
MERDIARGEPGYISPATSSYSSKSSDSEKENDMVEATSFINE